MRVLPSDPTKPPQRGGSKRSSWLTFRRRLSLIRCLLRGPAPREALWAAAIADLGANAWGDSPQAALRHDLHSLRREFACTIRYQPGVGYQIVTLGELHLFDLPDDHLQALHLLVALADTLPAQLAQSITELLAHLISLLPADRRLSRAETPTEHFDGPRGVATLDRLLLRRVRQALRRQQLIFRYRSTFTETSEGITHRVAPYGLLIRDGHLYLDADCLWADSAEWRACRLLYRLDRIIPTSLKVLPDVTPPIRLTAPTYTLRYELSPVIARQRDVALHFADSQVIYRDDGSALVTATSDDLWYARLILLRYGANCRVEAPPELITMMCETIRDMTNRYGM